MDCSKCSQTHILSTDPSNDDNDTLILIIKICFIVACIVNDIFFGLLPLRVKGCGQNQTFMGIANAFSGGLFLAISLYHILPDVVKDFDVWKIQNHINSNIPLPYILTFVGYAMILFIDRVMFDSNPLIDNENDNNQEKTHEIQKKVDASRLDSLNDAAE